MIKYLDWKEFVTVHSWASLQDQLLGLISAQGHMGNRNPGGRCYDMEEDSVKILFV